MGVQVKTLIALSVGAWALIWSGNIPLNEATLGATSISTLLVSTAEARAARSVNTQGRTGNRRPNRGDRHSTRIYH
jgi:hypothetical protein